MRDYTVYMHLFPDGKRYIGITSLRCNTRWREGKGYKTNERMTKAAQEIGWDNIEHLVLHTGLTRAEAEDLEANYIKQYDTCDPEFGYNICPGYHIVSEDTREKLRIKSTGRKHSDRTKQLLREMHIGTHASPETKLKMSDRRKGVSKSESTKARMALARGGKMVLCVETGEKYVSRNSAAQSSGIGKTQISACLHGKRETAGGFHWRYAT